MIRLEKLSRKFQVGNQVVHALDEVDLEINQNDYVSIMGVSGSGKSTLLKCLGVLMKPSAGGVILNGTPTTRKTGLELVKMRQETVSFIFQEGNLLPDLSALDNVAQPLRHRDVSPYEAREKARELLIELGLEERIYGFPETLSGGEQQRVAIARALITNPKLILADEPTGELDSNNAKSIFGLFKDMVVTQGMTIIAATHDSSLLSMADQVKEIRDGSLYAASTSELRYR